MTEALMGFTLGFLVVLTAVQLWKAAGAAKERARTLDKRIEDAGELAVLAHRIAEQARVAVNSLPTRSGEGASDAAIAQLAGRISKLEKDLAAQDLTILDTAERVAHKLQDRKRKRDEQTEVGDPDEIPNDPNLLLAHARAAFGVRAPDPSQLELVGGDS